MNLNALKVSEKFYFQIFTCMMKRVKLKLSIWYFFSPETNEGKEGTSPPVVTTPVRLNKVW